MSNIDKIKINDTDYGVIGKLPYGVCGTAAGTAAKTVTVDSKNFVLETGVTVIVKFTNSNSAASPTLNVNSTGAKPIMRYGTTTASTGTTTTGWITGAIQMFTYDGTNWIRDYWNNTTYSNLTLGQGYATCSTAAAAKAKAVSLADYSLTTGGIVVIKFTYDVPAGATLNINGKGAKAIYHKNAAIKDDVIKAGDIATFIYYSSAYRLISIDRWGEVSWNRLTEKPFEDTREYETVTFLNEGVTLTRRETSGTFVGTKTLSSSNAPSEGDSVTISLEGESVYDGKWEVGASDQKSYGSSSTVKISNYYIQSLKVTILSLDKIQYTLEYKTGTASGYFNTSSSITSIDPATTGKLTRLISGELIRLDNKYISAHKHLLNEISDSPIRAGTGEKSVILNRLGTASGDYSHAEGYLTEANGDYSHAEGRYTIASGDYQHVQGKFNTEDTENKYAHIVGNGNGTPVGNRSNAHTLDWDGNAWFAGNLSLGDSTMADFVIEEGNNAYWHYRKWKSGKAECWGNAIITGTTPTQLMGGYYSYASAPALPFTFSNVTSMIANGRLGTGVGSALALMNNGTVIIYVIGNTSSNSISYSCQITGNWK